MYEGVAVEAILVVMRKRVGRRRRRRRRKRRRRRRRRGSGNEKLSKGRELWYLRRGRRREDGSEVEGERREERNKDGRSCLRVSSPPSHTPDGNKRKKGRKLRSELKVGIRRCEGLSRGNSSY